MRKPRLREAGAAAVELAVALPIVLLIAVGIADYARAFATAITVSNAAKAAAQMGAQSSLMTGDTAAMNQAGRQDGLDASITVTSLRFCRCPDDTAQNCITGSCGTYGFPRIFVEATATKSVSTIFRYPGLPSSLNITRKATLRVQ